MCNKYCIKYGNEIDLIALVIILNCYINRDFLKENYFF